MSVVHHRILLLLLFLLKLTLTHTTALDANNNYDTICEEIVNAAKRCAQYHNQNKPSLASEAENDVVTHFDKAVSLEPNEPQAYMHMATFYSNSHQFDNSIKMWNTVLPLLQNSDRADLVNMAKQQIKHCQYGKLSKERDNIYSDGEGDIDAAVDMIRRQLDIYYSPRMLFDLATLLTMQSELDSAKYEEAEVHFQHAQETALSAAQTFQSFMAGQKRRLPGRKKACPRKTRLHSVGTVATTSKKLDFVRSKIEMTVEEPDVHFPASDAVYRTQYDSDTIRDVYLNELRDATLSGPDGVISKIVKCKLHVFATSEFPVVAMHANLWLAEDWKSNESFGIYDHSLERKYSPPNPSQRNTLVEEAATLISFSSIVFYHWMMNVVPRLVALLPTLSTKPNMKLIVPSKVHRKNHFIFKSLTMLLPESFDLTSRLVKYDTSEAPGVRMQVGKLLWVDWPVVNKKGGKKTHCLSSPAAMLAAQQQFFTTTYEHHLPEPPERRLLYVGRNGTSTRRLENEYLLVQRLERVAHENNWVFDIFDDGKSGMRESRDTFAKTSLVVGIHGSGLANLIFSQPGTHVVEIGFASVAAGHYRHASLSLGLVYSWIGLDADVHAMGKVHVKMEKGRMDQVVSRVEEIVKSIGGSEL
jgi:tetratricopeptide (TPR) repeat protein